MGTRLRESSESNRNCTFHTAFEAEIRTTVLTPSVAGQRLGDASFAPLREGKMSADVSLLAARLANSSSVATLAHPLLTARLSRNTRLRQLCGEGGGSIRHCGIFASCGDVDEKMRPF